MKAVDVEIHSKFAKQNHLGRGGRETDSRGFLASVSDRRLFGNWLGSINLVGGKFQKQIFRLDVGEEFKKEQFFF